ncbi:hypothetical protein Tco_1096751 [Tanacetum coccineum]
MVESSSQNPSSPEITPKEELVTLDKPESPNPFLPTSQVKFPLMKFLSQPTMKAQTQYKEYLCEFWYTAKTLDDSKFWVSTPTGLRGDCGKGTLKKIFLPLGGRILMGQIIQCLGGKTGGLDQISNKDATIMYCQWGKDVLVHSKDPKPSSQNKEVPQGKKPRAKSGLKRKQSSKHTSESKTEASKSKTSQSEKETQSSSAKDKSLSHPSPPTLVVGKIHKQAQQAVGCNTLADSTIEADPGTSAPNDFIPSQQDQTKYAGDGLKIAHTNSGTNKESRADEISKKIKMKDLSDLLKDIRSAFFTPDSLQDEPIIVSNESEEEETGKDEDTHATSYDIPEDTSVPHHPSHNSNLRVNDLGTSIRASCLPSQISSVQKKLKTLDSLPSLLNKVTKTLNRFATLVENASRATTKDVPLAGQATTSPAEGEKNIQSSYNGC